METKNKIVRYSECLRTDSEIKEPYHYDEKRTIDGIYIVPTVYSPMHKYFGQRIGKAEADAICAEYGLNFPSKEEIKMLKVAYDEAKTYLNDIKEDSDCWTSDNDSSDETDKKYLILFCYEAGAAKLVDKLYVLIDEQNLYYHAGIWIKPSLELLLGDRYSNLLQTQDHELFLQKEQKLTYIGRCKEIWYDEIIVCNTGIFQYINGEVRSLVKVDESREAYNNRNSGHQEWAKMEGVMPNGELICTYLTYDWCDDGEQTSEGEIEKRFRKDEQGIYQLCK